MRHTSRSPRMICAIGTLAHNRSFSIRDLTEYTGVDASALVRRMTRAGQLSRVSRGQYFPTSAGWNLIEVACARGRSILE